MSAAAPPPKKANPELRLLPDFSDPRYYTIQREQRRLPKILVAHARKDAAVQRASEVIRSLKSRSYLQECSGCAQEFSPIAESNQQLFSIQVLAPV